MKIIKIVLLSAILLLPGCGLVGDKAAPVRQPAETTLAFTEFTRHTESNVNIIDVSYPIFEKLNDVNIVIRERVDTYVDEFEENSELGNEEEKSSLAINFTPVLITPKIISITFTVYTYYVGGAHALTYKSPFNYSLEEDRELSLDDLFSDKEEGLEFLSLYSRQYLQSVLTDGEMVSESGTAPDEHNFSDFSIQEDGTITWYFIPYQAASFANGILEMKIAHDVIKDKLSPEFLTLLGK
ncbi:MAG: hypothetical protein A3I29_00445 [Candidatus Magasanikbacteria bacterium RIFCSPLOWO2_02_FULL_44_11]|uniref:DUF3298 domain-containing protein n=1 Tax=Candidatus Magasanikbacteria bacterium RIFCSPLOWO2_02_FULL_44_11 TaxID=1798689 RepID=A0A1F6N8S9_9BACT|nr:MAG: hypothetical protein A3I29_00445 [Candidatus Magasanikbacteria bacterium RIFCSPLOWO2_02_FULL_44_11]